MRKKRKHEQFTENEYNALNKLLTNTKLDDVFQIHQLADGSDWILDTEADEDLTLKDGLLEIYDGLAYSLLHDGLTEEEALCIKELFEEYEVADEEELEILLILEDE